MSRRADCYDNAPIPAEITDLTGITNEMVVGHRIDPEAAAAFATGAGNVIAHNANISQFAERYWLLAHLSSLQLPREQTPEASRDFAIFDPYLRHFLKSGLNAKRLDLKPVGVTAVAVELEPAPNLSYKSNSQVARLQIIRGELSPDVLASRALDDDMNMSIEGSVAQASVMWLLHRGLAVVQDCGESLEQQIVRFSTAVFDAIRTSYPMLRKAEHERLWLIYFKGLLTANTHPPEEMVSALRNIAYRSGFGQPPLAKGPGETAKPIPGRASDDDANALKQIARGLAENNSSFEM
jgi:hypothetical protein